MSPQPAPASAPGVLLPAFEDGLGRRYRPGSRNAETPPEILCFRHELTDVASFEFSLRERVARLAEFRHPYYSRIRKVDRLNDDRGTVALMSDCAPGARLADILASTERGGAPLTLDAALSLIRQLTSALSRLHEAAQVTHGAIAPERLIVNSTARLFVVEHVIGAALEQLRYSRERYWRELRVAMPMSAGLPHFDERADVTQVGAVALALILGRRLTDEDFPNRIEDLVAGATAQDASGARVPLPTELREWLKRALQIDMRHSFGSVATAQAALEQILSTNGKYNADVSAVEAFLARLHAAPAQMPAAAPKANVVRMESPVLPQPVAAPAAVRHEPDDDFDEDEDEDEDVSETSSADE